MEYVIGYFAIGAMIALYHRLWPAAWARSLEIRRLTLEKIGMLHREKETRTSYTMVLFILWMLVWFPVYGTQFILSILSLFHRQ